MNVLILWHRKIIVSLVLAISFFDMFTIQAFAATPSTVVPAKTETTPFHYAGTDTSISSNPAAVNVVTGTGTLQRFVEEKLGIQNDHGIYVGGAWIADANQLFFRWDIRS
jgi:porin